MSEMMACTRMTQAGIKVVNWAAIAADLQPDWRNAETAERTLDIFNQHLPFYGLLSTSQDAVKNGIPGLNVPR